MMNEFELSPLDVAYLRSRLPNDIADLDRARADADRSWDGAKQLHATAQLLRAENTRLKKERALVYVLCGVLAITAVWGFAVAIAARR